LPWRQLEERDRWALVFQIKTFSTRFSREPQGRPIPIPLAPRETESLQDRGEQLYVDMRCGACHGDQGAGDGPGLKALRFPRDRAVRVRDFTRGRFIRGTDLEDIFLTLRLGIDGIPMPPLVDLRDHDLWALAAYVRLLVQQQPLYGLPPAREKPTPAEGHRPR
jgi:mono/diheme cytochrome c family protein